LEKVAHSEKTVVTRVDPRKGESYYEFMAPIYVREMGKPSDTGGASGGIPILGVVRVGLSLKSLNVELSKILWISISLTVGTFLVCMLISTLFLRKIIHPVGEMAATATRISAGDFTQEVRVRSRDEVGILGNAFNRMITALKGVIGNIQNASTNVVSTARQIGLSSNNVTEGAQIQARSVESIMASVEEINTSIHDVAQGLDLLSSSTDSTSSSILQMEASIQEVAKNTGVLESAIEDTSSAILEMSTSIQQVAEHAEVLSTSVEQTLSDAQEIDASVAAVAVSVKKSAVLSEKVRDDAEKMGLGAVQKTMEGMDHIRDTINSLSKVVNSLGERSEQIGGILTIIDEVTEQTSLLALNAAILAAQSGEHGRGFAVVAGEIKELAERTAASTKEIAQLIGDVQKEVGDAVVLTQKGIDTVEEGVSLSNESDTVLRKILESAEESLKMARQIEFATVEQADGIRRVAESIQNNSEMVHHIARATQEQRLGSKRIMEATQRMRDTAMMVRQAMVEQAKGSKQVAEAATNVSSRVQEMAASLNEQTKENQKITNAIDEIRDITHRNVSVASEMAVAVNTLARQSEILEEQISDFKV
jgi:methyl-accepting chemotaxis protein